MAHVTLVHGIANKPPAGTLAGLWERALAEDDGLDLGSEGISTTMVYWADVLYPAPAEGTLERADDATWLDDPGEGWQEETSQPERAWLASFARALPLDEEVASLPADGSAQGYERVLLPAWMKQRLLRTLLRDVHHYLFNARHTPRPGEQFDVRDEIRARMLGALREGAGDPGPHVVISHSMGTVIAYDCLKRVEGCPPVDGLVTIGSPLGIEEIPLQLRPGWSRRDGFPYGTLHGPWINIFDPLDPVVGALPAVARLYRRAGDDVVVDVRQHNWGRWRHDIAKYLHGDELRTELARLLQV